MITVVFADILGFSRSSLAPGAVPAVDALSDVAQILSTRHTLAQYLQAPIWRARYALSDSLFLLADDPVQASAAAEIFFNLAFSNSAQDSAVLMRGAITMGGVREVGPLFPETARSNLVGEAVTRATQLEKCGAKGPRLLVSDEVGCALRAAPAPGGPAWILDRHLPDPEEMLWLLPPNPADVEPLMVGEVAGVALRLVRCHGRDHETAAHYLAYLDLAIRALSRLHERDPVAAEIAIRKAELAAAPALLESVLDGCQEPEIAIQERLHRLLGGK